MGQGIRATVAATAVLSILSPEPLAATRSSVEGDRAEFEEGLDLARRQMRMGRWSKALEHIQSLLDEHAGEPYVRIMRTRIVDEVKRCRFRMEHDEPQPASVVGGELVSWNASSGKIELRYRDRELFRELADWKPLKADEFVVDGDWLYYGGFAQHSLAFAGPYDLELTCDLGTDTDTVVVSGPEEAFLVQFALGGCRIVTLREGESKAPETDLGSLPGSGARRIKIAVGSKSIALYVEGKKMMSVRAKGGHIGSFALVRGIDMEALTIDGKAQPSWIQGAVDESLQETWDRFEETYDPNEDLPEWLRLERPPQHGDEGERGEHAEFLAELPGPERSAHEKVLKMVLEEETPADALESVERLDSSSCTEEFLLLLQIRLLKLLERYEEALELSHELCMLAPEHVPTLLENALLVGEVDGRDAGILELRKLAESLPESAEVRTALAIQLLVSERAEEARAVIDAAILEGIDRLGLEEVDHMLDRALRGPSWFRMEDYTSKHYHVATNIDRATAYDLSKELEGAYKKYSRDLGHLPRSSRRFQVYVFSGLAGYLDYGGDLLGSEPAGSAGLYLPHLKQLLIWNLPIRENMVRTVRHEGFHQYFDRLVGDSPVWLNEGLAEYYETSELHRGSWRDGLPHPSHMQLVVMPRLEWTPIEDFVYIGDRQFRAQPALHYAQAWSLVHLLRHGTREDRGMFDSLLALLASGATNESALREVFGGREPGLQRRFDEHLAALRRGEFD